RQRGRHDPNSASGYDAGGELDRRDSLAARLARAHARITAVPPPGGRRWGAVTGHGHQAIDLLGPQQCDRLLHATGILERIGAGSPEDGSPQREDAANRGRCQFLDSTGAQHAGPSVLDSSDLEPPLKSAPGDATNGGIEAGRVSTASENADAHDA